MEILIVIFSLLLSIFFYVCILALIFAVIKAIVSKGKAFKFSKPPLALLLASVIAGVAITGLYTAQMDFSQQNDCGYYEYAGNGVVTYPAQNLTCTDLSYGYPQKFVSGHTTVGFTKHLPANVDSSDISAGSEIQLDKSAMIVDLVVWSTASFFVLCAIYFSMLPAAPKKKRK